MKLVNGFQSLTIFAKSSFIDIWDIGEVSGCAYRMPDRITPY